MSRHAYEFELAAKDGTTIKYRSVKISESREKKMQLGFRLSFLQLCSLVFYLRYETLLHLIKVLAPFFRQLS